MNLPERTSSLPNLTNSSDQEVPQISAQIDAHDVAVALNRSFLGSTSLNDSTRAQLISLLQEQLQILEPMLVTHKHQTLQAQLGQLQHMTQTL